ncbi:maker272 [Drosophila busckii]|uniref:Maker272 n=1 Tax=Drosophila busckii TaxID=30019 RepID=A0A0M4F8M4_DROBS|nr:uncharacterized protein LOC108606667 [Drosophila busckii]ALC48382.1 maker272 [Drosophila busckii]
MTDKGNELENVEANVVENIDIETALEELFKRILGNLKSGNTSAREELNNNAQILEELQEEKSRLLTNLNMASFNELGSRENLIGTAMNLNSVQGSIAQHWDSRFALDGSYLKAYEDHCKEAVKAMEESTAAESSACFDEFSEKEHKELHELTKKAREQYMTIRNADYEKVKQHIKEYEDKLQSLSGELQILEQYAQEASDIKEQMLLTLKTRALGIMKPN